MKTKTSAGNGRNKVIKKTEVFSSTCKKTSYSSRKIALARAAAQRRYSGEEIYAYRCTRGCHSWHLGHPPRSKGQRLDDAS